MLRNTAGQKLHVFAFDVTTGAAKTGDGANITAFVNKDYAGVTVLGDTTATELSSTNAPGWYQFDLTGGETDAIFLHFTAKSSTTNVSVVGARIYTDPQNYTAQRIDNNGYHSITLADIADPSGNSAKQLGILWAGTLASINNTSITLPGGHNLDTQGDYAVRLMSGTNAFGKARYLKFNSSNTWDVDPSWISDGETAPSGTITAIIINAEKLPTTTLPNVNVANASVVAAAVVDLALSGHTGAGTVGGAINAAGSSGDPWATTLPGAYTGTQAGNILGSKLDAQVSTRLPTSSYTAPPTAATISAAVVDQALAGHTTAGSAGAALAAAAIDPLTEAVPGAYAAGTAGNILGNRLDVAVSSRLATSGYSPPDNSDIVAIKAVTDQLRFTVANRVDVQILGAQANTINASALATDAVTEITTAIAALAIDGSYTLAQVLAVAAASLGGRLSGVGTGTVTIRDLSNTKNVIVATVDATGRTAVTLNV